MGTRTIMESRTTILYMAAFGIFLLLSYMFIVAPIKKENESHIRSFYSTDNSQESGTPVNQTK